MRCSGVAEDLLLVASNHEVFMSKLAISISRHTGFLTQADSIDAGLVIVVVVEPLNPT